MFPPEKDISGVGNFKIENIFNAWIGSYKKD